MSRFATGFLLAAALVLATAALAVMPPEAYRQARQSAGHHVQIRVTDISAPFWTPGQCDVEGTVVRIFKSAKDLLSLDSPVAFSVDCLRPGDEPGVGPVLWKSVKGLRAARFMEVYLNGADPGRLAVAGWQLRILDEPTQSPTCPEDAPGLSC